MLTYFYQSAGMIAIESVIQSTNRSGMGKEPDLPKPFNELSMCAYLVKKLPSMPLPESDDTIGLEEFSRSHQISRGHDLILKPTDIDEYSKNPSGREFFMQMVLCNVALFTQLCLRKDKRGGGRWAMKSWQWHRQSVRGHSIPQNPF